MRTVDALGNASSDTNGGAFYGVDTAGWGTFFSESFDSDPGWTIDNGGFPTTGWAYGVPTGQGQDGYGGPDPDGRVHRDRTSMASTSQGTSPPMPRTTRSSSPHRCSISSAATSVQLRFQRWLGVERDTYDHARIRLSTDAGASWQTVWENDGTTIDDTAWVEQVVELPTAVGHDRVQIRWTYGSTDGSWNYCGWNIDDVVVEGARPCEETSMVFTDGFETGDCWMWQLAFGEE